MFYLVYITYLAFSFFFFQAEDGIRDYKVTGVQTCALPIYDRPLRRSRHRPRPHRRGEPGRHTDRARAAPPGRRRAGRGRRGRRRPARLGDGRRRGLRASRDLSSGRVRPPRRRPRRRDGHAAHGDRRGRRLRRRRPLHGRRRPRGRRRPGVRALRDGAPVSDGLVVKLLSLIVFVACSALFTGAEAAYFSLGRARLKRVAAQGAEGGGVKPLIERPHELLVTLLVAIT